MRPLDPLLVISSSSAILCLRASLANRLAMQPHLPLIESEELLAMTFEDAEMAPEIPVS
jgi:hypothetical protein